MARIFKNPFAYAGDKTEIAESSQPDGRISIEDGWTTDYELPNDEPNYKPVERDEMNGLFNEVTAAIGDLQLNGFPVWKSISGGWPSTAIVAHNGSVWKSTSDNNNGEPGVDESWTLFRGNGGSIYPSVADMIADTELQEGYIVQTLEHTSGYGYEGGNLYKIVPGGTGTADNMGHIFDLDNGLQAIGLFPGGGLHAAQFGAGVGAARKVETNAALSYLLDYINIVDGGGIRGGVITFGPGDWHCGAIAKEFVGRSENGKERGIAGAGVGNTNLIFDNAENTPVIKGDDVGPVFWTRFEGFTATASVGAKKAYLFDFLDHGFPRCKMQDIQAVNFKDPFRIFSWVSSFNRLESQFNKVGFTWQSGTSMDTGSCFALTCDYGHMIGCRLNDDGSFTAGRMLSYSSLKALASDNSTVADYVIGDAETTTVQNSGAEAMSGSVFMWPDLPDLLGNQTTKARRVTFDNISVASAKPGSTLFSIGRENLGTRFRELSSSSGITNLMNLLNGLSFDTAVINLDIDDYSAAPLGLPRINNSIRVDGVYTSNVASNLYGVASEFANRGDVLFRYRTRLTKLAGERIRLGLIGSTTGRNEQLSARVRISPCNNASHTPTNTYVGEAIIAAQATSAGVAYSAVSQNAINHDRLSVTTGPSVKNTGGTDVIISLTGFDADVAHYVEIDLEASTMSWPGQHHAIYIS